MNQGGKEDGVGCKEEENIEQEAKRKRRQSRKQGGRW
jgi:hypothetical protein